MRSEHWKCYAVFLTKPWSLLLGTTLKSFLCGCWWSNTNKYMELNFLHKIDSTTNTSHLWDWPTVKEMDIRLLCIRYCFHGPDQPMLTDAGREKACLIFKQEHGVQNVCQPLQGWKVILMTCSRLLKLKWSL